MNDSKRSPNELLYLVTLAVAAVVGAITIVATTTHVTFLVVALVLLMLALGVVIAEVIRLASDDDEPTHTAPH